MEAKMEMPMAVFGTMEYVDGSCKPSALEQATLDALNAGYRHLDCAEVYTSTEYVGRAIARSGMDRKDLWITTKLKGLCEGDYDTVKERMNKHLALLGLDRVDLVLLHFPGQSTLDFGAAPEEGEQLCGLDWFKANLAEGWGNLLRLRDEGLASNVGVSNCYSAHINTFNELGLELPYANELYIDPCHQENDLVESMKALGIHVLGYRCVAFFGVYDMVEGMGIPVSSTIATHAESLGMGARALFLSTLHQRGIYTIAKSCSLEHIAANLVAQSAVSAEKVTPDINREILDLDIHAEMINMMGGCDEYAMMFKRCSL